MWVRISSNVGPTQTLLQICALRALPSVPKGGQPSAGEGLRPAWRSRRATILAGGRGFALGVLCRLFRLYDGKVDEARVWGRSAMTLGPIWARR